MCRGKSWSDVFLPKKVNVTSMLIKMLSMKFQNNIYCKREKSNCDVFISQKNVSPDGTKI